VAKPGSLQRGVALHANATLLLLLKPALLYYNILMLNSLRWPIALIMVAAAAWLAAKSQVKAWLLLILGELGSGARCGGRHEHHLRVMFMRRIHYHRRRCRLAVCRLLCSFYHNIFNR